MMPEREYDLMRQVEDVYWWYRVLRQTVTSDVKALAGSAPASILDAGCGTGGMMDALRGTQFSWRLTGLDFSPQAVETTRRRGFDDVHEGSVDALPMAGASFDGLVSLDVLYFEGVNEARAIAEFHRVLRPGGFVILNLPAFDFLRGEHDVAVRGARRYTPAGVRGLLARGGFEVIRSHCWNAWLFPPILAWRLLSRLKGRSAVEARSDLALLPSPLNALLLAFARADMALCRALRAPFGTSVYAVARRA